MVSPISAVAAYQKVLKANKGIVPSGDAPQINPTAILRQGDDLQIVAQNRGAEKPSTFGDVLQEEFLKAPIRNISSANKTLFEVAQAEGGDLGPNLVELVAAVDKAQLTVNALVTVRDKILGAYQEILKMPL